jgi:DNA-binding CsgD family transcriptional regulator
MTVDTERLAALHAEGRSAREIAEALECAPRTVSRWRSRTGHNIRSAAVTYPPSTHERARRLIEDGCSLEEVARTVGTTGKTIARWFPDARRMTPTERGEWARFCKLNRHVLSLPTVQPNRSQA